MSSHSPLQENRGEFRLLTILPPKGLSEEIHCELEHYPLQECKRGGDNKPLSRRFIALSYTWGSEKDRRIIYVNNEAVPVLPNLEKALRALRSLDIVQAGCKIWADALCIDQGSIHERNREVVRMKEIYRCALHVVVWLGDALDGSDEVMDFCNGVSAAQAEGVPATARYMRHVFATQGALLWQRMTQFITRPYFFRLWIIQEVVMGGGRDTLVLCGSKATTWTALHLVYHNFQIFEGKKWQDRDQGLAAVFHAELRRAKPAVFTAYRDVEFWKWQKCEDLRFLQDTQREGRNRADYQLLNRCRVALCSDPRDKVYGILGLLSHAMAAQIVPDYGRAVDLVLADFTRAWIAAEHSLRALTQAGSSGEHYQRDPALPSWVVDLRQEIKQKVLDSYAADGGRNAPVAFSADGRVMTAKGILFDVVDGTSGVRSWEEDCYEAADPIVDSECRANPYGDGDGFREALWRTFVGNRDGFRQVATQPFSCLLDAAILDTHHASWLNKEYAGVALTENDSLYLDMHLWVRRNADFIVHQGQPLRAFFHDTGMLDDQPELYQECARRALDFLWYTRLITTRRGYVGSAPRPVQRGDVVAVLLGCPSPLLLRRCGWTFEIVSECYVEGIMEGELLRQVDEGKQIVEDISIS